MFTNPCRDLSQFMLEERAPVSCKNRITTRPCRLYAGSSQNNPDSHFKPHKSYNLTKTLWNTKEEKTYKAWDIRSVLNDSMTAHKIQQLYLKIRYDKLNWKSTFGSEVGQSYAITISQCFVLSAGCIYQVSNWYLKICRGKCGQLRKIQTHIQKLIPKNEAFTKN